MNKLILASASPRRKEILENFQVPFDIIPANVEESIHEGEEAKQIAMALAFEKALNVLQYCEADDIVIAADTVVYKNEIFGKPLNYEDAYRMLNLLQNDIHVVISGIAVMQKSTDIKIVDFESTKVKLKKLEHERIQKYIESGEVWDKAGSYAIQGKGSLLVDWIKGDYFNVVGLPISKLDDILRKYFKIELM
ncbi:septum formation protein Maf [Geosporobacter ferrireducens]|uniref:dTTP/UTP pyrophosphatase n=1 Tax=Geosporobacter ferrireducens TaxID=1424294 RepID=A0A1D8GP77_9FIRM|nr:Maf family protein [Geosporobacter ferrireducens]AOT72750.1 septum formation protein Maf [Geosporobacter ferrireducens]MTI55164.1 septum formation protein Maf [Geosporobacter ferrireducens]